MKSSQSKCKKKIQAKLGPERAQAKFPKTLFFLRFFWTFCLLLDPCGSALGIPAACTFGKNRSKTICFILFWTIWTSPSWALRRRSVKMLKMIQAKLGPERAQAKFPKTLFFFRLFEHFCLLLGHHGSSPNRYVFHNYTKKHWFPSILEYFHASLCAVLAHPKSIRKISNLHPWQKSN